MTDMFPVILILYVHINNQEGRHLDGVMKIKVTLDKIDQLLIEYTYDND